MGVVIERRLVEQYWYETEMTKTGWDSYGWRFSGGEDIDMFTGEPIWSVAEVIKYDKNNNPILGIAEREIEI